MKTFQTMIFESPLIKLLINTDLLTSKANARVILDLPHALLEAAPFDWPAVLLFVWPVGDDVFGEEERSGRGEMETMLKTQY